MTNPNLYGTASARYWREYRQTVGRPILRRVGSNALAVDLAEAKQYLRIDHPDDDLQVTALLRAAQMYAEDYCRLTITYQRWEMLFDEIPETTFLELPRRHLYCHPGGVPGIDSALLVNRADEPVEFLRIDNSAGTGSPANLTHLELLASPIIRFSEYDQNGATQDVTWLPGSGNFEAWDGNPPLIYLNSAPNVAGRYGLKVDFTTGFGKDHTTTPEPLKQIILLLAGNWYLNREANSGIAGPLPFGVDMMLRQFDTGEYR